MDDLWNILVNFLIDNLNIHPGSKLLGTFERDGKKYTLEFKEVKQSRTSIHGINTELKS